MRANLKAACMVSGVVILAADLFFPRSVRVWALGMVLLGIGFVL